MSIPGLSPSAHRTHAFPSLKSHSLLSIGSLCDHWCTIIFTAHHVTVTIVHTVVLTGTQSTATGGLWTLNPVPLLSHPCPHTANSIVFGSVNGTLNNDTITNHVAFYHTSML
jgi:hypothetical protein